MATFQFNSFFQFIKALLTKKHTVPWLKLTKKRYNIMYINDSYIQGGLQSTVYQSDIAVSLSLFICVKKSENLLTMISSSLLIM